MIPVDRGFLPVCVSQSQSPSPVAWSQRLYGRRRPERAPLRCTVGLHLY
jgi:hypothetical protein